jgi:hypothetical protein
MDTDDLKRLFPADYSKKQGGISERYRLVTDKNFFQYCIIANRQFEYLYLNKKLSGFYFVDFRCNFSELQEFSSINFHNRKNEEICYAINEFLNNYELAGNILYERFEEEDNENENLSDFV